jgi:hypothetical protein
MIATTTRIRGLGVRILVVPVIMGADHGTTGAPVTGCTRLEQAGPGIGEPR